MAEQALAPDPGMQDEDRAFDVIEQAIANADGPGIVAALERFSDADARHMFFEFDAEDRAIMLTLMPADWAARFIAPLPVVEISFLLERVEPAVAAAIIDEFDSSEAAEVIEELEPEDARAITALLKAETAREVAAIADYEEDSAGWLMDTDPLVFQSDNTIRDVLQLIIDDETALDSAEGQHPYVISPDRDLLGVLSLRDLLIARRATPLVDVMIPAVSVRPEMPLDELKNFFDEHDYLGAPVVDATGRLIGAVAKEAVMDAWRIRLQQNAQKARGVVADELRSMPLLFRSRRRLAWLSANIFLNVIAASVISSFEATLSAVIALAIFLPMVSDMSGCSGNQAVAVSMRELSIGLARPSDVFRVWWKEVSVGLINGVVLGIIIGLVAWAWKGNPVLGGVIGLALAINTVIAVSIGGCVPLLLKRMNVDPAVASGPLLTTITDMAGFFLVLGFATLALPWLV